MRAQLCVHVRKRKALAASPSLQHSLSFTPGRLLRNVSGREAKISILLLLLTAWADKLWGPSRPLGPWGEEELLGKGRVWGGDMRPSSSTPSFLPSWTPKPGPRVTSVRKPSRTFWSCHMLGCVCVCVCSVQSCLGGRYSLHQIRGCCGQDHVSSISPGGDLGGQGLPTRGSGDGLYLSSSAWVGGSIGKLMLFPLVPRVKGYSPGGMGSSGAGPGATRAPLTQGTSAATQGLWGREESQLGSHPRPACVCVGGRDMSGPVVLPGTCVPSHVRLLVCLHLCPCCQQLPALNPRQSMKVWGVGCSQ